MSTVQELENQNAELRRQLDNHARAETEKHVVNKVTAAVEASGVALHPTAVNQVIGLLRNQVSILNHNGETHIVGSGLRPLNDFVKDRLAGDDFAHFRISSPATPKPVDPRPRSFLGLVGESLRPFTQAVGASDCGYGSLPAEDGSGSIGTRLIRAAQDRAAQAKDPRYDMSAGFGLRPRR
jgi:hypothetical protein